MRKPVPVSQAENLQPQAKPIEAGAWQGIIEETRIRELPDSFIGDDPQHRGFSSTDVEALSLQIGSLEPLEGQDDPGNQKYFTNPDIIVRDGEYDIEDEDIPDQYWQIADRSYRMVVNLANALDFVDEVEMENGEIGLLVQDEFFDILKSGKLKGQKVGFVVTQRTYKKNDGSEGVAVEVKTFTPAV